MPAGAGWVACRRQPVGRHERELRRQTGDRKWGRREFLAESCKARRKADPQAEENLENPEVTPLHTLKNPAQKSASTPARLARKRLGKTVMKWEFKVKGGKILSIKYSVGTTYINGLSLQSFALFVL